MRDAALFLVLIPRNIGVLLIRVYRAVISPLYGDVCRYYPSCSAYGLGSVQQRGLLIGSMLAAWRILRCNPWSSGGIDDVRPARHGRYRTTSFGWVVPAGFGSGTDAAAHAPRGAHAHSRSKLHSHDAAGSQSLTFSSPTVSRKD
ncbi:membrane protein insertion efficiency factor YidD [Agromyces albus]|uniref:membrane protein insertion efficiency factor YidD n=1 Tax=Agromyces albus TaxID=205332 RepID=UPI0026A0F0C4